MEVAEVVAAAKTGLLLTVTIVIHLTPIEDIRDIQGITEIEDTRGTTEVEDTQGITEVEDTRGTAGPTTATASDLTTITTGPVTMDTTINIVVGMTTTTELILT